MKRVLSILAVAALVLSLTGCGGEDEKVLRIFNPKVEVEAAFQDLVDAYAEENGIKIELESCGGGCDYAGTLSAELSKSEAPTIYAINGTSSLTEYENYLYKLDDTGLVDAVSVPVYLSDVTNDKGTFGIPLATEYYGAMVNTKLLEKLVDAPIPGVDTSSVDSILAALRSSYDEQVTITSYIQDTKDELGVEGAWATAGKETWVVGNHGSSATFARLDEFATVAATNDFVANNTLSEDGEYWDYYESLVFVYKNFSTESDESLITVSYDDSLAAFAGGDAFFLQQGDWAFNTIATSMAEGGEFDPMNDIEAIPMPVDADENFEMYHNVTGSFWSVNSHASEEEIQMAVDFLNYMYNSSESNDIIVGQLGLNAPYKKVTDSTENAISASISERIQEGASVSATVFPSFPKGTGFVMNVLGANIQLFYTGDMTWDEVVEESTAKWNEFAAE